jgi:hypothetical protein
LVGRTSGVSEADKRRTYFLATISQSPAAVLASYNIIESNGFYALQELHLLVPNRLSFKADWTFHGEKGQHLHQGSTRLLHHGGPSAIKKHHLSPLTLSWHWMHGEDLEYQVKLLNKYQ